MKYLKIIIPTFVFTVILCYICITPAAKTQLKSFTKDGDNYYIVTVDKDKYITKLIKNNIYLNQEWVNMDTKEMIPNRTVPFITDSGNLFGIVVKLNEENRVKHLIKVSEGK